MNTLAQTDAKTLIHELSEKTSVPEEELHIKMNEKIQKFSGLLTEQGALILLSREMNVRLPVFEKQNPSLKLGELKEGMNNVDVTCTVKMADRIKTYSKNGKEGKYLSLRLMDESGEALFTFWNEHADEAMQKGLQAGSKITLTNARVGSFNQQMQLSLGYNGVYSIENNPNMQNVAREKPVQKTIPFSELTENQFAEGKAHIVDVLQGKGYYVRCLSCQGKLTTRTTTCPICMAEGKIETRLLVPLLLDDGTKTLRAVAFENEVIQIYEKTKEELLSMFDMQKEEAHNGIRGKIIQFTGKTKIGLDNTSIELILQKATPLPFTNP